MQNQNDKTNDKSNESSQGEDILDEAELDQVSGGGHGHGHGHGNNNNNSKGSNSMGDGSVRFITPTPGSTTSITDGTSNTILFGEK
ncbi:MAG: DUF1559 domain-containing protein [Chloroflexi bacterium]|nr:DUF1559 domain-containing protein [Chloroflexota bacterium]OJV89469.1 MAG: hypothetical protein BGO39_36485 [Chloroflexi bacterium 54-19]